VEPQTHEPMEVDIHTDHTADDDNEVLYISDNLQIDIAEDTDTLETPQSEQSSSSSETSSVALLASSSTAPSKPSLHTKLGNAFYKALSPIHDQETSRKIQKLDKLRYTQESQGQSSTRYSIRIYHHTGRNAAKATPFSDTSSRNYTYV